MIEILASVKAAVSTAKAVAELSRTAGNADLRLEIANLTGQLADIKLAAVELAEENADLKREVARLSAPPAMDFRDGGLWDGARGPFCPNCFESGRKAQMSAFTGPFTVFGKFECPSCDYKIT